jgi:hypothetical protein
MSYLGSFLLLVKDYVRRLGFHYIELHIDSQAVTRLIFMERRTKSSHLDGA